MNTSINRSRPDRSHAAQRLLTVARIAERLDVCERTVRRLIQSGHLKSLRVGRCLRITEEDFQAYVARCRSGASRPQESM